VEWGGGGSRLKLIDVCYCTQGGGGGSSTVTDDESDSGCSGSDYYEKKFADEGQIICIHYISIYIYIHSKLFYINLNKSTVCIFSNILQLIV